MESHKISVKATKGGGQQWGGRSCLTGVQHACHKAQATALDTQVRGQDRTPSATGPVGGPCGGSRVRKWRSQISEI